MLKELEKLQEEIKHTAEAENRSYYFGRFLPSTDVMFVAERPTVPKPISKWNPFDNFNLSVSDLRFVELLNKYGFGGSYITDIVKTTAPPGRPSEEEIETHFPYLLKEIEAIKPKIIVAISYETFKALQNRRDRFADKSIRLEWLWHPAHVRQYNRWDKYEEKIKELRQSLGKLSLESRNLESL